MTTHLVTGEQGYVGRFLTRELLNRRADATVIGVGRSAFDGDVLERHVYERADILDSARMRELFERHRPEQIFHLAAAPSSGSAVEITRVNVLGSMTLLDAIVSVGNYRPRVVIASSGSVYGALDDRHLPASESAPCVPVDVLGASKLAAEHLSRIVGERHGVCVMAARIFDFIDVRDVASALAVIGDLGACGDAYNISRGEEIALPGMSRALRNYGDATRLRRLGFVQRGERANDP